MRREIIPLRQSVLETFCSNCHTGLSILDAEHLVESLVLESNLETLKLIAANGAQQ